MIFLKHIRGKAENDEKRVKFRIFVEKREEETRWEGGRREGAEEGESGRRAAVRREREKRRKDGGKQANECWHSLLF